MPWLIPVKNGNWDIRHCFLMWLTKPRKWSGWSSTAPQSPCHLFKNSSFFSWSWFLLRISLYFDKFGYQHQNVYRFLIYRIGLYQAPEKGTLATSKVLSETLTLLMKKIHAAGIKTGLQGIHAFFRSGFKYKPDLSTLFNHISEESIQFQKIQYSFLSILTLIENKEEIQLLIKYKTANCIITIFHWLCNMWNRYLV